MHNAKSFSIKAVLAGFITLAAVLFTFGGCTPTYPNCDSDKHCAEQGEVCVDGTCRQCRTDSQCSAIDSCMTCQANACVRVPNCCKSDTDCAFGRCQGGECAAECSLNSDCEAGQVCKNGRCEAPTGCDGDADCPAGLKCSGGECVAGCDIETIYFDFDEYAIRMDQEGLVRANADCLKETEAGSVTVEGHTDERGSDEYNLTLGERRARSVTKQYEILGVKNVQRPLSFGLERPACSGSGEQCWKQNRRAETKVR